MSLASEVLIGLSTEELEALADGKLALSSQGRLDDLLAKGNTRSLSLEEEGELDGLLRKADQLTILKSRARYTLSLAKAQATGT